MTPDSVKASRAFDERALIALPQNEIHLWIANYDEIEDVQLLADYREMLNGTERRQEPRFYFPADRRRYLVTRALVRSVLSRYVRRAASDWIFTTNAFGRPEIANEDMRDAQIVFNISHTHSMIVLGVARGRALGVDVENVLTREASIDIAGHYFARSEVAALFDLPAHERGLRFFEYWTFKESYIKARGMGLSLPLDRFGFRFANARAVEIDIHPELADEPSRWRFWQFRLTPEYLLAVCAERIGQQPQIVIRKTVPLRSEAFVAIDAVRSSRASPFPERAAPARSALNVFNSPRRDR